MEHNYHPRIYRYSEEVTILQVGDTELDFNHPERTFTIWWQSGSRNVRVWPRWQNQVNQVVCGRVRGDNQRLSDIAPLKAR